jgi:alanine racemase
MGRFGLFPSEVERFSAQIARLPGLELEGVFTHFATADSSDKSFAHRQFETLLRVADTLEQAGHSIRFRHASNSAATFDLPHTHLNAVRIGIALYGLRPSSEVAPAISLSPVLSLHSRIVRLKTLPAGSSVGYGRTFVARQPTRVALIPVGYGDGYHRALSGKGEVLICGQRAPVVGRISMDQLSVDATHISNAAEGDEAVLIGPQGNERITAEEVAALAGTINYEVTTSLLPRLARVYVQSGEVIAVTSLMHPLPEHPALPEKSARHDDRQYRQRD